MSRRCEHCGAERQLYHPCPSCGRPTFESREEEVVTPDEVLAQVSRFRKQCKEAEYTDTGEAWELIDALEDALIEVWRL